MPEPELPPQTTVLGPCTPPLLWLDTFTDDLDRGEHNAKYGWECSENDVSDEPISLAESELRNVRMELLCEDDMTTVVSNRWDDDDPTSKRVGNPRHRRHYCRR